MTTMKREYIRRIRSRMVAGSGSGDSYPSDGLNAYCISNASIHLLGRSDLDPCTAFGAELFDGLTAPASVAAYFMFQALGENGLATTGLAIWDSGCSVLRFCGTSGLQCLRPEGQANDRSDHGGRYLTLPAP